MAQAMPTVGEDVWAKRHAKRSAGVRAVRNTPEYQAFQLLQGRPETPDPSARTSKRDWEKQMQAWRRELQNALGPTTQTNADAA
jgi:hypothetical protein